MVSLGRVGALGAWRGRGRSTGGGGGGSSGVVVVVVVVVMWWWYCGIVVM